MYGALRWRGKIDAILKAHLRRALPDVDPLTRNLLRVALYQLRFLGKIPDYAAVNEAVEIAKRIQEGCVVTIACDRGDRYCAPMRWEKHYDW